MIRAQAILYDETPGLAGYSREVGGVAQVCGGGESVAVLIGAVKKPRSFSLKSSLSRNAHVERFRGLSLVAASEC